MRRPAKYLDRSSYSARPGSPCSPRWLSPVAVVSGSGPVAGVSGCTVNIFLPLVRSAGFWYSLYFTSQLCGCLRDPVPRLCLQTGRQPTQRHAGRIVPVRRSPPRHRGNLPNLERRNGAGMNDISGLWGGRPWSWNSFKSSLKQASSSAWGGVETAAKWVRKNPATAIGYGAAGACLVATAGICGVATMGAAAVSIGARGLHFAKNRNKRVLAWIS